MINNWDTSIPKQLVPAQGHMVIRTEAIPIHCSRWSLKRCIFRTTDGCLYKRRGGDAGEPKPSRCAGGVLAWDELVEASILLVAGRLEGLLPCHFISVKIST